MTGMWKRHVLTDYVFARWKKEKEFCKDYDVTLLAVGSEEGVSKNIADKNGFVYVEVKNEPLNRKNNFGSMSVKEFNPDFVIYVNSDTLFSVGIINALISRAREGFFWGLRDLYNLSIKHKRIGYWPGWTGTSRRVCEPIGTGRCFSREILEKVDWKLWDHHVYINCGLDYNCRNKLVKHGFEFDSFYMSDLKIEAVEAKTDTNIWKWESVVHRKLIAGVELTRILSRIGASDIFEKVKYEQNNS